MKHFEMPCHLSAACVAALLAGLSSHPAHAGGGPITWQGDDATSPTDFGVAENWDFGFVPSGEPMRFPDNASGFIVDLNETRFTENLRFLGTAGYTFNGGTLAIDDPSIGGIFVEPASVTHTINSTVDLHNGNQQNMNIGAGATLNLSGAVISDSAFPSTQLIKNGTGTLTLNGANTYTADTAINAGTLLVGNTAGSATGTGNVTVNNGATLGGDGSVAGSVNVAPGGTVAPGVSVGVLTLDAVVFSSGPFGDSSLNIEVAGSGGVPGTDHDQLVVNNTVDLIDGDLNLTYTGGFTPTHGQAITVVDAATVIDTFSTISAPDGGGWAPTYDDAAGDVILTFGADFDWLPAAGGYATAGNWGANMTPDANANVLIRNGGTASANTGGPALARDLTVGDVVNGGDGTLTLDGVGLDVHRNLNIAATQLSERTATVGDQTVAGSITVENTAQFSVGSPGTSSLGTSVATTQAGAGQTVNATGSLTIDNVATVNLGGRGLFAGATESLALTSEYGDARITSHATVRITNAQDVTVDGLLELATVSFGATTADAVIDARADLVVGNIAGTLSIDSEFRVGTNSANGDGNTAARATATLSDIGNATIGGGVRVGSVAWFTESSSSGTVTSHGTVAVTNVASLTIDGDLDIGVSRVTRVGSGAVTGTLNATGVLTLDNVAATLGPFGSTRVGQVTDFSSTPITGATHSATGTLNLTGSSLATRRLEVGIKTAGTVADVSGTLNLDSAFVAVQTLTLSDGSHLAVTLDGTTRATAANALSGATDLYPAIDATAESTIDGTLDVTLGPGFTPTGTDVFTLINVAGLLTGEFDNAVSFTRIGIRGSAGSFEIFAFGFDDGNGNFTSSLQLANFLPGLEGDYNADGFVSQSDLDLVLLNWGDDASATPAGWTNDLPTGLISQNELDGVLLNWGSGTPPILTAIPEPASGGLVLLGLGGMTLLARRRNCSPE